MPVQSKDKSLWFKLCFVAVLLIVVAILVSLGRWQLQRAEEKRVVKATLQARSTSRPFWVGKTELRLPASVYRRAKARGRFDSQHTLFLDNQIHRGRAGYYVLVPLRLADGEDAILVNRGWIPMGLNRQHLPVVETPDSQITVRGMLRRPYRPPFFLGNKKSRAAAGWPKRVQYVDLERLEARLGYTLKPLILYLNPDEPHGFVRQWSVLPSGVSVQRHIAYAIQWFALAIVAVVIFVILYRRYLISDKGRRDIEYHGD